MTTPQNRMYWLHAHSPVHVGAGSGVGVIDLPIMREAVTNWPLIPGTAIKGVLSDKHGADEKQRNPDGKTGDELKRATLRRLAFGRSGNEQPSNAGALVFTDAQIVCFPVRSMFGTFAWVTCPFALSRLKRDLMRAGTGSDLPDVSLPGTANEQGSIEVHVPDSPASVLVETNEIYFEDLDFVAKLCGNAAKWAKAIADQVFPAPTDNDSGEKKKKTGDAPWSELFQQRFAVVPDDVFTFLCETATQVDARTKIDSETKIVADGQLWYEESLPTETILAGRVWCDKVYGERNGITMDDLFNEFCNANEENQFLQIGGNASVGRGQVQIRFACQK